MESVDKDFSRNGGVKIFTETVDVPIRYNTGRKSSPGPLARRGAAGSLYKYVF